MPMESSLTAPFLTWQFAATCIAIYGIMATLKVGLQIVAATSPKLAKVLATGWFQGFVMTPMNLVLGVLFALPPGWLVPKDQPGRIILGICAGFLSVFVYTMVKKRITSAIGDAKVEDKTADKTV